MNVANQIPPSSMVDLISTKLIWAFMPIPVIVTLSGLIDFRQHTEPTHHQLTTYSAATSSTRPIGVDAIASLASPNSDEVQYFQDRAAQFRTTLTE